ncbi:MAG: DUF4266 domain-containing protein [Chitinophagaceae bacterium]|uniref:DUF4266 domain-containing protein n=1 Tax=unclassified Paraflavitalea TaxID=2798305 RepID=UPI003D351919|nr:DUF4266 domain-containing protein [Chitinophagaceae bacterium]
MKKIRFFSIAGMIIILVGTSCATVRPYQKNKLNDAEMELAARKIERGDMSFQTYREGSSGANGGKAGGGCGCN